MHGRKMRYSWRQEVAGCWLEGSSPERLLFAIATRKVRVFGLKEEEQKVLKACCRCQAEEYYLWARWERWIG